MSNTKLEFMDDVQRFMRMFPGLAKFAEEVGSLGSIEQAAKDTQNRLEALKAQESDARAKAEAAQTQLAALGVAVAEKQSLRDKMIADLDAELDAKRKGHQDSLDKASADARAASEQERDGIIARAQEEAANIVASANEQATQVQQSTHAAQEKLDDIKRATVQMQERHDEVAGHLEALRRKFSNS